MMPGDNGEEHKGDQEKGEIELRNVERTNADVKMEIKENNVKMEIKENKVKMSRALLTFLGFIIMYGPLQATTYSVALPEVQDSLKCSDTELGLTMSVFIFAAAIFPLVSGPAADRVGRRPVLLTGLIFFAIGSTFCALSQNAIQMILSRFIQGVGFAICSVIPITVISDLVPPEEKGKYVSYLYLFIFAGPSIGPLIGGFIAEFLHWRFIFVVLAVSSLVMIILTPFVLPETLDKTKKRRVSPIESLLKLGDTKLLFPAISAAMSFGGLWVRGVRARSARISIKSLSHVDTRISLKALKTHSFIS